MCPSAYVEAKDHLGEGFSPQSALEKSGPLDRLMELG